MQEKNHASVMSVKRFGCTGNLKQHLIRIHHSVVGNCAIKKVFAGAVEKSLNSKITSLNTDRQFLSGDSMDRRQEYLSHSCWRMFPGVHFAEETETK